MQNGWEDVSDQMQSTFKKGVGMTNISIIDDKKEDNFKVTSINLKNIAPENKKLFVKNFVEEAEKRLTAIYGENSIKKSMVKDIENMLNKYNGINTHDLGAIAAVYDKRGKINYGKNIYRDFSENLYEVDKLLRESSVTPYNCMKEALKKTSRDILGIDIDI